MKPWAMALLSTFTLLPQQSDGVEEVIVLNADSLGFVSLKTAPEHVSDLVARILSTDMRPFLLSEEKGSRWLVTRVTITDENLGLVRLSDGNGVEGVLFDRSYGKKWNIIRRTPIGDWKPERERKGDRLTSLSFPPTSAEQSAPAQPAPRPLTK